MDSMCRKRNVSDGDSGFDSALSSRSSSISLDQEHEFSKEPLFTPCLSPPDLSLREEWSHLLDPEEELEREEQLLLFINRVTGQETLFKPPTRLKFSSLPPSEHLTHSGADYDRNNTIPRSALFHARLEYELEKQIQDMDLVEVNLVMKPGLTPPPSLGIRVIGVNMIHGVPDTLNIFVKRIVEDSVAGLDGHIKVNDQIVEVNGTSLIGVSQRLAAQTLSNCAICPDTGTVHFVLARPPGSSKQETLETTDDEEKVTPFNAVTETASDKTENNQNGEAAGLDDEAGDESLDFKAGLLAAQIEPDFVGRDAVRLIYKESTTVGSSTVVTKMERMKWILRVNKVKVLVTSMILLLAFVSPIACAE